MTTECQETKRVESGPPLTNVAVYKVIQFAFFLLIGYAADGLLTHIVEYFKLGKWTTALLAIVEIYILWKLAEVVMGLALLMFGLIASLFVRADLSRRD